MGWMDTGLRAGAFAIGVMGTIIFFRSIFQVAMLNRYHRDAIGLGIGRVVRAAAIGLARRATHYDHVQGVLAWAFPLYILGLLVAWFVLVQVAFAFMIWAVKAEATILNAFIASGSALSTLGFSTPSSTAGRLLAILEGAFGLGIVVFIFTFIPGYRSAVEAREDKVGWLYARVGSRPMSLGLIDWCHRTGQLQEMSSLWDDWEGWFRGLVETHSLTPLLAFVPSVYRGRTWVGAAVTILDAAAFSLSSLDIKGLESARLCHVTGVEALRLVASELADGNGAAARENAQELIAAYDAAYERSVAAGLPMRPGRDECRQAFLGLRSQYVEPACRIAAAALMPLEEHVVRSKA